MFHNWYSNDWWRQPTPNCDTDQIQSVLEFSLLFGHYPRIPDDMRNVTNVGNLVSIYTHVMMVVFTKKICCMHM